MIEDVKACCEHLADARTLDNSLVRTNDNGLELISVGYDIVDGAYHWHDFPLLFCPSCGATVQTHAQIRAMNGPPLDPASGHCCRFRERAATGPSHPTIVAEGSTECIAVGFVATERGMGFMELRVDYCPFCGRAHTN